MAPTAPSRPDVRERARRALRAEITAQALTLIAERGFDAITVDQLASAVGVSRRTLFRLFATKEDIVVAAFEDLGEEALVALRARRPEEPAWTALRRALDPIVARLEERPEIFFALHEVIADTPALRGRLLALRDGWRVGFARELCARAGSRQPSLESELLAAAAIAALDVASERWVRAGGRRRLVSLLDESFELLSSALAAR